MILLSKIRLNNFLSHEETTIEFGDNEKLLLDGVSGAGKSSIFDAIIWCLYGQGRADNRSLVRKGAEKGSVELTLKIVKDVTVRITRHVSSSGKHTLEVVYDRPEGTIAHSLTGLKELQAWIEHDLIGASYLLFVNSVAYVQGNSESFVDQTAGRRRELLLEIVKAEDYDLYYDKAKIVADEENLEKAKIVDRLSFIDEWTTRAKIEIAKEPALREDLAIKELALSDMTTLRTGWVDKKSEHVAARNSIKTIEAIADDFKRSVRDQEEVVISAQEQIKDIPDLESTSKDLEPIAARLAEVLKQISSAEDMASIEMELMARKPDDVTNHYKNAITRAEADIVTLSAQHNCPAGDDCPHQKDIPAKVAKLQTEIADNKTKLAKNIEDMNSWTKDFTAAGNFKLSPSLPTLRTERDQLQGQIAKASTTALRLQTLTTLKETLPQEVSKLEEKRKHLLEAEAKVAEAKKSIDMEAWATLERQIDDADRFIVGINEKVINIKASLEGITRAKADQVKSQEEVRLLNENLVMIETKLRKVELVKAAFGAKGIKAVVLDYMLPKLEDSINEILSMLSDFRIRLDTQQAKVNDDGVKEGLFITIINDSGDELPYESYSGGEKLKIQVSISEALASLQNVGFRLFDETFLGLDENSTEAFTGVLERLQARFGQVLCISHLLMIKALFDKRVNVRKHNGTSYVE